MKPGFKTTEFWASLAAGIGTAVASIAGSLPPEWAAPVSGGLAVAYTFARAAVKIADAFFSKTGQGEL
jgi:hypothetical protein